MCNLLSNLIAKNMERWPRPSRKRAKERSDNHWQRVSNMLWHLRELESAEIVTEHAKLFKDILNILMKRQNFVADAELWKELYLRSIWQLPNFTTLGTAPISVVVKHNHVLSFYMRHLRNGHADVPIVHWDSHTDNNPVEGSAVLPELHKKGTEAAIRDAQEITWDIGAAISGVILATGPRTFVWCMPAWLPDAEFKCQYWLSQGTKNLTMTTATPDTAAEKKAIATSSLNTAAKIPAGATCATYAQIQMSKATGDARLLSLLPGDGYILDCDIDYFCSNGRPVDGTYEKDPYDVASHHRIPRRELIENPRDIYLKDSKEFRTYARAVAKEMALVKSRLAAFERTLRYLKAHGKIAVLITISDSTEANFTECVDCSSLCNSYVPGHLALYLRTKVVEILNRVRVWEC